MSKRILIVVNGGVADWVADDGIEVGLFDFDNYEAGDKIEIPSEFADLANIMGIPDECIGE